MKKLMDSNPIKKQNKKKKKSNKNRTVFRCSAISLWELVGKFKYALTDEHIKLMKGTQFWNFFKLFYNNEMKSDMLLKTVSSISLIIHMYSDKHDGFVIGNKVIKLKGEDVAICFGMSMKGKTIIPSERLPTAILRTTRLYRKYFKGQGTISRELIESAIELALMGRKSGNDDEKMKMEIEDEVEETMEEKREREEDAVKLIILHMVTFIFFPNKTGTCPTSYIEYVKSFEMINSISWPCSIQKCVMDKIQMCKGETSAVTACVILLLYFISEHVKICKPERGHENTFPRAGKWNLQIVGWKLEKRIAQLNDDEISENMWVPKTKKEEELINGNEEDVENPMEEDSLDEDYYLTALEIEEEHIVKQKENEIKILKEKLTKSEEEKGIMKQEIEKLKKENNMLKNKMYAVEDPLQMLADCGLQLFEENEKGEKEEKKQEEKKIVSIWRGVEEGKRVKQKNDNHVEPEPQKKKSRVDASQTNADQGNPVDIASGHWFVELEGESEFGRTGGWEGLIYIGNFPVLEKFAALYRQIWLRHGHLATRNVMKSSTFMLVVAVSKLLESVTVMATVKLAELDASHFADWDGKIAEAEAFKFEVGWLRKHFDEMRKTLDAAFSLSNSQATHEKALNSALQRQSTARARRDACKVQLEEAEQELEQVTLEVIQHDLVVSGDIAAKKKYMSFFEKTFLQNAI